MRFRSAKGTGGVWARLKRGAGCAPVLIALITAASERTKPGAKGVRVINIGGTQALVAPPRAQPVTHQRLSPRPTSGGLNSNPFSREGRGTTYTTPRAPE